MVWLIFVLFCLYVTIRFSWEFVCRTCIEQYIFKRQTVNFVRTTVPIWRNCVRYHPICIFTESVYFYKSTCFVVIIYLLVLLVLCSWYFLYILTTITDSDGHNSIYIRLDWVKVLWDQISYLEQSNVEFWKVALKLLKKPVKRNLSQINDVKWVKSKLNTLISNLFQNITNSSVFSI